MRSGWHLSQRSHDTEWHCVASGDVARKAHECKQYEDNMNRKTYFCTRTYIKNHETNKCSNLIDGTNKMTNNNNNNTILATIKKIHLNNKWTIAIISRAFDEIGICLCLCVSVSVICMNWECEEHLHSTFGRYKMWKCRCLHWSQLHLFGHFSAILLTQCEPAR